MPTDTLQDRLRRRDEEEEWARKATFVDSRHENMARWGFDQVRARGYVVLRDFKAEAYRRGQDYKTAMLGWRLLKVLAKKNHPTWKRRKTVVEAED